jgi:hypothetical protein
VVVVVEEAVEVAVEEAVEVAVKVAVCQVALAAVLLDKTVFQAYCTQK